MKSFIVLTFILLHGYAFAACPDVLISSPTSYQCTSDAASRKVDPSKFTIPPGQKALTAIITLRLNSICSLQSSDRVPLLTIAYGLSGSEKSVMDLKWRQGYSVILSAQQNSGGSQSMVTEPTSLLNKWMTLAGSINLNSKNGGMAMNSPDRVDSGVTLLDFTLTSLDATTLSVYACSTFDGAQGVECDISELRFVYKFFQPLNQIVLGNSPVLLGRYQFTEGSGSSVQSTVNTMGAATLAAGLDSPIWGQGLSFTERNQYITLPPFIPQGLEHFETTTASFGIVFWVKPSEFAASSSEDDPIFVYTGSDSTTARFGLYLTDIGKIKVKIDTEVVTSRLALTQSSWTQIFARLFLTTAPGTPRKAYFALNFGSSYAVLPDFRAISSALTPSTFTTDTGFVKVGGFRGSIADLRIYSPMPITLQSPTCSSCELEGGFMNPPACMVSTCGSATYSPACIACPVGCTTCTSDTECQTCSAGYVLPVSGGTCTQCSGRTYLASPTDTSCTNCPDGCATCTSATECQTCSVGYVLPVSGGTCTQCSGRTYAASPTATSCSNCPDGCATCTSATECQSCSANYKQQGSLCVLRTTPSDPSSPPDPSSPSTPTVIASEEESSDNTKYFAIGFGTGGALVIIFAIVVIYRWRIIWKRRRNIPTQIAEKSPDSP